MQSNYSPLYNIKITLGPYIVYDYRVAIPSEVYLAYNSDMDRKCCVKIIEKKEECNIEKIIHQQIQLIVHQNITRIYQIIEQKNHIYIFQETCEKDLSKQKLDPSNFIQMLDFIYQISDGYITLKNNGIIHRDLKPEKILVKEDLQQNRYIYKICDFGISKIEQSQRQQTPINKGTAAYSAPEISQYEYSWAADAYSFGLVLIEILLQKNLSDIKKQIDFFLKENRLKQWFEQKNDFKNQYQQLIVLDQLNNSDKINPFLLEILEKLLIFNPEKRIQWEQLNSQVKTKLNQFIKSLSAQDLKPKNIQQQQTNQQQPSFQNNQNLPAISIAAGQHLQNQPTSDNSRLCQSLVTHINQPQQQQNYQGMNQHQNQPINNFQNMQQRNPQNAIQFQNNISPQQVQQSNAQIFQPMTPRQNGNATTTFNFQQQSPAPLQQVNQPGIPQALQKRN